MPRTKIANGLQPIEKGKIYPLPVFQRHSGWGRHAMREARRQGLKTIRSGGRIFVRGKDFFAYLDAVAD